MSHPVETVTASESAAAAAERLRETDIGSLLVDAGSLPPK